jgi:hypothetical protein
MKFLIIKHLYMNNDNISAEYTKPKKKRKKLNHYRLDVRLNKDFRSLIITISVFQT